jgi:hypothetical protein
MKQMKGTSDSNTWVPIVVGVLGLLAAGVAVRHCGSTPSPEPLTGPQLAAKARLPGNERSGWIAQSGTENRGTESARSGTTGGMVGHSSSGSGGGSDPDDFGSARGGRGSDARDFRDTDTMDAGGDAINAPPRVAPAGNATGGLGVPEGSAGAAGGVPPVPGQDHAGQPGSDKAAAPQTEQVAQASDPAKTGAQDDNGPVFSLPLDKSTQPEKGDTAPVIANGVTFDANGAQFDVNAQLFIPNGGNVNPAAGTITFWMLPQWAGDTTSDAILVHLGGGDFENHATFFKNGRYLRYLFADNSGWEAGGSRDVADWKPGDRHMVTGTWGDGVTVFYIDGVPVDAHDYSGNLVLGPSPPLYIGSGTPSIKGGASSNIRNFQVYARALNSDEVAALYAQPPS